MAKKVVSEIKRSKINPKTVSQLWGISAGRCEICNKLLHIDSTFGVEGNYSENAHIHAVSAGGPRHAKDMFKEDVNNIQNLMLLCAEHHKMIDDEPIFFEAGYLVSLKEEHEHRIREVTSIRNGQTVRMVSYIAPIDGKCPEHSTVLFRQAVVHNKQYPQQHEVISLNVTNATYEPCAEYFSLRSDELSKSYHEEMKHITKDEAIAVFPFGLQPLLIKLGVLLSDQNNVTVYQCHREGHKWAWPTGGDNTDLEFIKVCPADRVATEMALIIDLSAKVADERIVSILGSRTPIWHLTTGEPNRYFVKSVSVQAAFSKAFRGVFESIRVKMPECKMVHLFPVMPVSLNVRLGMDYMPKSDLPLMIYDQGSANNGFFPTIRIGGE